MRSTVGSPSPAPGIWRRPTRIFWTLTPSPAAGWTSTRTARSCCGRTPTARKSATFRPATSIPMSLRSSSRSVIPISMRCASGSMEARWSLRLRRRSSVPEWDSRRPSAPPDDPTRRPARTTASTVKWVRRSARRSNRPVAAAERPPLPRRKRPPRSNGRAPQVPRANGPAPPAAVPTPANFANTVVPPAPDDRPAQHRAGEQYNTYRQS